VSHRREKHPKQIAREQKARWLTRARLIAGVIIFLIFTAIPVGLSYFPHLSVTKSGTVRSRDAMGTIFDVTNNGILPLYDVDQGCGFDQVKYAGGEISGISMTPFEYKLGTLAPGDTKSLNCEKTLALGGTQFDIAIEITYRPLLWPWRITKSFPFEAEKADDGTWVWKQK
jgi:hypothetical protein